MAPPQVYAPQESMRYSPNLRELQSSPEIFHTPEKIDAERNTVSTAIELLLL